MISRLLVRAETWIFDVWHNVETSQTTPQLHGPANDWYWYLPIRAKAARHLLRRLPIPDCREYTFLDIGSGKGRMVLLASELPFNRVIGVEVDCGLHAAALRNIADARRFRLKCASVEVVKRDAAAYDLPPGKLIVYLFNPFGGATLQKFLTRLKRSYEHAPRDILLIFGFVEPKLIRESLPDTTQLTPITPVFYCARLQL